MARIVELPLKVLAPYWGWHGGGERPGMIVNVRFIFNGNSRQRRKMLRIYKTVRNAKP